MILYLSKKETTEKRKLKLNLSLKKMYLSVPGEDISLQTVEGKVEVHNNHGKDAECFYLNSLPPGYRFNPTDAEMIVYYLRKKVDHQPLPPNKIIEVNLYAYDPEELAGSSSL